MTTKDAPGERADPPTANDFTRDPSSTAASAVDRPANDPSLWMSEQLLGLTVGHPAVGVCVVAVDGELDMDTAPLLEACLRDQLATGLEQADIEGLGLRAGLARWHEHNADVACRSRRAHRSASCLVVRLEEQLDV